jgi:arylformamidase
MIHDVSVPVQPGMVVYPGDPTVSLTRVQSLAAGDIANISLLELGVHTGTHVDAPLHFFDGAEAVEGLDLGTLVGPAQVLEVPGNGDVDAAAHEGLDQGVDRVLFKTRNSEAWARDEFYEGFATIAPDAAERLVAAGIRLVGIDYLSVGSPETHRTLLGAGVVAIEGLDLRAIAPGTYTLVCLPLKLVGADGAPARVVLIDEP